MKRKDHAEKINRIFGGKFLQHNNIHNCANLRLTLHRRDEDKGEYLEIRELTLDEANEYELQDNEAIIGRVHNGKGYIPAMYGLVPSTDYGFTVDEWNSYVGEAQKSHTEPADDNFQSEVHEIIARLKRLSGSPEFNDQAVEQSLSSLSCMLQIIGDCDNRGVWQALYYAYYAGKWGAHTHATEEHIADIQKGLAHTKEQKGRNKGARNKSSKAKEKELAQAIHEEKKMRILKLWEEDEKHSTYDFMDKLADPVHGLASEKAGLYQLAGKGKFLSAPDCTRKIRDWLKKMP